MNTRRALALVAALALVTAACSSSDDTDTATDTTVEGGTDAGTTDTPADDGDDAGDDADAGDDNTIIVVETDAGPVLATADNFVIYVFDDDEPGVSNCDGDCATAWPPVLDDGQVWPDSVEFDTGTLTRDDGTEQLWVAGLPIYYYAPDGEGEATGQGVGGVWWTLNPDGSVNRTG